MRATASQHNEYFSRFLHFQILKCRFLNTSQFPDYIIVLEEIKRLGCELLLFVYAADARSHVGGYFPARMPNRLISPFRNH